MPWYRVCYHLSCHDNDTKWCYHVMSSPDIILQALLHLFFSLSPYIFQYIFQSANLHPIGIPRADRWIGGIWWFILWYWNDNDVMSCHDIGYVMSCHDIGYVMSCHDIGYYDIMISYVMSCHDIGYVMSCHDIGYVMSCHDIGYVMMSCPCYWHYGMSGRHITSSCNDSLKSKRLITISIIKFCTQRF